jgi:uncharacterized protein (DUF58 family)
MNAALNHDFCPQFNRWVYWLKNPLWCLLLATGLSAACGIFLSPAALFVTAILSVIAAIGVVLPWLAMRGIDLHLTFDIPRSRVGQPVLIRLKVRNRWPWPVWGLSVVRGFSLSDAKETSEGVSLARVPGWSTVDYSWQFVPQVRGLYPLSAPEVETAFPFGFFRAARQATVDGRVVVWPRTVNLSGLPDAVELRQMDENLADRRVGDFGDMLGTREFRQGDSLRRVHWAQTARQQRLIVCERQAPATSAVRVTLDLDPASHPQCDPSRPHPEDTVELAVNVAASVCESLHRQHCRVELSLGQKLYVVGEGAAQFHRLMDELAQARLSDSSIAMNPRAASGSFMITVTTPVGQLRQLRRVANQHIISVSDGTPMQHPVDAKTWISLSNANELETVLPRRWKGACNVR